MLEKIPSLKSIADCLSTILRMLGIERVVYIGSAAIMALAFFIILLMSHHRQARLERKVAGLELLAEKNEILRADLDHTKAQLAPFVKIADSHFPTVQQDKRLDLLARGVEALTQKVHEQAAALPAGSLLTVPAAQRIKSKLDYAGHVNVRVVASSEQKPVLDLATQVALLFKDCGFNVTGVDVLHGIQTHGVTVSAKKPVAAPLLEAFNQLFTEINQPPSIKTGGVMSNADVEIIVAER
jgi:hypothetical protein